MTAVSKKESLVPALVATPANSITAEDITPSRLKVGQFSSSLVQEGLVEAGDLFLSTGPDDGDPVIVDSPAVFHVLALRKGKSDDSTGELERYDFDDPDAPASAWVTYDYTIALPEVDDIMPAKWLLTRSSKSAAQVINTIRLKNQDKGPWYELAYQVEVVLRKNPKGQFYVFRVKHIEAHPANVAIAEKLAIQISGNESDIKSTGEVPAI